MYDFHDFTDTCKSIIFAILYPQSTHPELALEIGSILVPKVAYEEL